MAVLRLRARGGVYVFNLGPGTDLLRPRDYVSCEGRMSSSCQREGVSSTILLCEAQSAERRKMNLFR